MVPPFTSVLKRGSSVSRIWVGEVEPKPRLKSWPLNRFSLNASTFALALAWRSTTASSVTRACGEVVLNDPPLAGVKPVLIVNESPG